ncbi:MAG TPA: valine--tRNA ligase [Pseudonocardia sp.]|nr:valine--tRNA ligase [Pseudonocardia sp.]
MSTSGTSPHRPARTPDRPTLDGLEERWSRAWEESGTYRFDRNRTRAEIYSIDTPPPTVSGSLHVGHVFSYTHTDLIARYKRMRGFEVFYPMGWDDNGLPTERRVQNYFGVRCDPSVAYDPDFVPPEKPNPKSTVPVSRRNFVDLCHVLTDEDEKVFESLWRLVGLSVDWSLLYTTIGDDARAVAQRGFLNNLDRGEAYLSHAPTLWDVTFQTAVAQAEVEARNYPGAFHRLAFGRDGGQPVLIETTRPELLASCVALIANPADDRYAGLFGSTVRVPLFGHEVPVLAHQAAESDKGTGIAMCCTFGDMADVQWWRELQLPTRTVIGRDGRFARELPDWLGSERGVEVYTGIAGKTVHSAREQIVAALRESGELVADPVPVSRMANFYEKGDRPLEIVATRQWYIRNGGREEKLREQLIERGRELTWVPEFMRQRYENWVNGLNGDWLISRQRFFGVPFPVWYPLDADGEPRYDEPLLPPVDRLPVDPAIEAPEGYAEAQRGEPNGFLADPDVMDTWATSSLSPQVATGWLRDPDLFARTFPMDLRPQAHDIIRTWLFSTVLRAQLEHDSLPWTHAAISGFVVDPDRKKMSKSKGNVVVPREILDNYGADAVRWRAAMARPGTDSPFDEGQMRVGRRLAIKILNMSKFVLSFGIEDGIEEAGPELITEPLDRAALEVLKQTVDQAGAAFEEYDYSRALESTERFFWMFCDDYVELVKQRAYGEVADPRTRSARAALLAALDVLLRLFAPFMPYVTEEVWSWWHDDSIHRRPWPRRAELGTPAGDPRILEQAAHVLSRVRGAKSEAKVSMRTGVSTLVVEGPAALVELARSAAPDIVDAARATTDVVWRGGTDGEGLRVQATLVAAGT